MEPGEAGCWHAMLNANLGKRQIFALAQGYLSVAVHRKPMYGVVDAPLPSLVPVTELSPNSWHQGHVTFLN